MEFFLSFLKKHLLFELIPIVPDYQYFYLNMPTKGLHIIFLILGIFVLILGLYAFPINCRFNVKLKPNTDRLMTSTADALHFIDCVNDLIVSNSLA